MAGLLPPLLAQYTLETQKTVIDLTTLQALGELIIRTSYFDNVSFERLAEVSIVDPMVSSKMAKFDLNAQIEFADRCPRLINEVKYYGQIEIDKYNKILENFDSKIATLNQNSLAVTMSLSDFMLDFAATVLSFSLLSMQNILTLATRDLLRCSINVLDLVGGIWPEYIQEALATGGASIDFPGFAFNGVFQGNFISGLMGMQSALLENEILYLIEKIAEYILMPALALLLMMAYFLVVSELLMTMLLEITIELMEQEMGKLSVSLLPPMIEIAVEVAVAELKAIQAAGEALSIGTDIANQQVDINDIQINGSIA